jgi:uncharacterized membrane protein YbhN (UPF0104 family)
VTFYLGMLILIGSACLLEPHPITNETHVATLFVRIVGGMMLMVVALYMYWSIKRKVPLRVHRLHFPIPTPGLSLAQLLVASLDLALAGSVLYVLLPGKLDITMAGFLGLFMIAQVLAVGSQVPGGLGVFETIMLHVLTPALNETDILASLLVYRVIYYLVPLTMAAAMLGLYELLTKRRLPAREVAIEVEREIEAETQRARREMVESIEHIVKPDRNDHEGASQR